MLQLTERDTLDTLISSDRQSGLIHFGPIAAQTYVERSEGGIVIPYMHNVLRSKDYMFSSNNYRKTGELKKFLKHIDLVCTIKGYKVIRIEGVVNEFLPGALVRYGYIEEVVSIDPFVPSNYVYYL